MHTRWMSLASSVVVVGALAVVGVRPARACSCAPRPSLAEAAAHADAVFQGRPSRADGRATDSTFGRLIEFRFSVSRRWKGEIPATVSVWTPDTCAACGVGIEEGADHIVLANRHDDRLLMLLCSGGGAITAATDLASLGMGQPPADPVEAPSGGGCAVAGGDPTVASAVLGLAAVALSRRRRRVERHR